MNEATLLQISGVKKRFGPTQALDGVDLALRAGEVHALIGENGAGKSTLMNILSASIRPDAGSIVFQGEPFRPADPLEARRRGIAHINQELSLCGHLSVAENVFLGNEPQRQGWVDYRALNDRATEMLAVFQHPAITPQRRVADLAISARQIVEICRALAQGASLILMDEPTSSLQKRDIERLFDVIRRLRASGVSILYISHFLEEVREIADRFTVLRDGKTILTGAIHETTDQQMIGAMVGRTVEDLFPPRVPAIATEPALEAEKLSASGVLRASFQVRRGEVLGIAGLIGSGRSELLRALFGLEKTRAGKVKLLGQKLPMHASPQHRIARGMGYLSEDRKGEGLLLPMSMADNVTLTNFASCACAGWIDLGEQQRQAQERVDAVQVRGATVTASVQKLSGGNQQKVALARLLHQGCQVFLLDEPTRGVDIGSKAQIHALIVSLARAGKAVVMVSSYFPELFGVCDRVAVMSRGVLSSARPVEQWTPEEAMRIAIGTSE